MAVLGQSQSGPPPDQILDPPLVSTCVSVSVSHWDFERNLGITKKFAHHDGNISLSFSKLIYLGKCG